MADPSSSSSSSSSSSFLGRHWAGWKDYWGGRFAFADNYQRFIQTRDKPIPLWSKSDVEDFIASDPVNGPTLKATREASKIAALGTAIGAISSAGVVWRYSKSPHGVVLSLGAGAVFGWTFGQEAASHWLHLYKADTMAAQTKFLDWWVNKSEGQS